MALPIIRIPRLQQSIPVVDAQGRQTSEFKKRLDETFGSISDAFVQIQGALDSIQMLVDQLAVAVVQIQAAQAAAVAAQTSANTAGTAAISAQTRADDAYTRADDAYALAGNAVPKDAGPAWSAATGAANRATFDTTTVLLPDLAQRVKALVDDLQSNGALT